MSQSSNPLNRAELWTLLDAAGKSAVTFTSFISLEVRSEGQALSYPIESGSFANYNKSNSPMEIITTLAAQGGENEFGEILTRLEQYKRGAVTLSVCTPSSFYPSMTLEAYSYRRSQDSGAGILQVELNLTEVRIVPNLGARAKNPTSTSNAIRGLSQVFFTGPVGVGAFGALSIYTARTQPRIQQ